MGKAHERTGVQMMDDMTDWECIVMSSFVVLFDATSFWMVIVLSKEGHTWEGIAIVVFFAAVLVYVIFGNWVERLRGKGCG